MRAAAILFDTAEGAEPAAAADIFRRVIELVEPSLEAKDVVPSISAAATIVSKSSARLVFNALACVGCVRGLRAPSTTIPSSHEFQANAVAWEVWEAARKQAKKQVGANAPWELSRQLDDAAARKSVSRHAVRALAASA